MRAVRPSLRPARPAAAPSRRAAFSSTPSRRTAATQVVPNEAKNVAPKAPAEVGISDACVERLKQLSEKNKKEAILRLEVVPAGCSGFSYKFGLISTPDVKKDDKIFEKNGAKVAVDELSTSFLQSCTIDFEKSLIREAFKVTNNAKAESACSCGTSFSPKV